MSEAHEPALTLGKLLDFSLPPFLIGKELGNTDTFDKGQWIDQMLLKRKCRGSTSQSSAHIVLILPGTSEMLDCTVGEE